MNGEASALARVAVLIVNYNAGDWLRRAVECVRPPGHDQPEVVIVDNGSSDASLDGLDALDVVLDRADANLGFAAGINRAAGHTGRELLLLLNPDCLIEPSALERLVEELDRHPEAALVSCKILGEDGREQRASRRRLPRPKILIGELLPGADGVDLSQTAAPGQSVELEAVSGACMLIRRSAFAALGGLDTGYPMHFEDLDLFARLRAAGWTLRWVPAVTALHAGGRSSTTRPLGVEFDKHRGLWRYLSRHCHDQWPRWQRPLWALALAGHLLLRLAMRMPAAVFGRGR